MKILKKILLALPMLALFTNAYSMNNDEYEARYGSLSKYPKYFTSPTSGYFLTPIGNKIHFYNHTPPNYSYSNNNYSKFLCDSEKYNYYQQYNKSAPGKNTNNEERFWTDGMVNYIIDKDFTIEEHDEIVFALYEMQRLVNSDITNEWENGTLKQRIGFGKYEFTKSCDSNNLCFITKTMESRVPDYRRYNSNYIFFKKTYSGGCNSFVGMQGGKQIINLNVNANCVNERTIIHETMHALGFHHEQQRFDRDQYIILNWHNIPGGKDNINYMSLNEYTIRFGHYDYNSIMHYHSAPYPGYKGDDLRTIEGNRVSINDKLSNLDIDGLRKAYPIITLR